MDSILVVDDEPDIIELVKFNLEREGYHVYPCLNGSDALSVLHDEVVDLAILDVMLPGMNGFDICRKMRDDRRLKNIPVLFMTARTGEADVLDGFASGGDDYLTKPFSTKILLARVRALLHRNGSDKETYGFQDLELFFDRHVLRINGERIAMTPREYAVLSSLILRKTRTISRNSLLERGWGMETTSSPRSVDIVITRLRNKLGKYGPCIRTVTGYGYQWDEEAIEEG
jgi:two-component system, OmpR family, alkaline phosphatase synthesis response regulator PhoP